MDRQQLRLAIRAWLTGVLASVVVLWFVFHTYLRTSFWDAMSERPLTDAETEQLTRCEMDEEPPDAGRSPSWWTWLKLVHGDAEAACGELWFVEGLTEKVRDEDRALWLQQLAAQPELPVRTRMRVALSLLMAGRASDDEPAWLIDALPPDQRGTWITAAGRSERIAAQLGPRGSGLGALSRARSGGLSEPDVLPMLYWLSRVDDPGAEQEATTLAATLAEVPLGLAELIRTRRAAGLPVPHPAARFARLVEDHPECGAPPTGRCAAFYAEVLDAVLTDAAFEEGGVVPQDLPEPSAIAEVLTAVEAPLFERRAAVRGLAVASDWVRAAPDPAKRLRSLAARTPDDRWSFARVAWDGGGTPLLSALAIHQIGEAAGVPVEVRSDVNGAMWLRIDGVDVVRSCATPAPGPDSSPWPLAGLVAGALLERAGQLGEADATTKRRLVMAAQRSDPLIGGPLAAQIASTSAPALAIGRRVGASLFGPLNVPAGADAARRMIGERGPPVCPPRSLAP